MKEIKKNIKKIKIKFQWKIFFFSLKTQSIFILK